MLPTWMLSFLASAFSTALRSRAEIGERREGERPEAVLDDGAVGRGALRKQQLAKLDLVGKPAAGADADQRLEAVGR